MLGKSLKRQRSGRSLHVGELAKLAGSAALESMLGRLSFEERCAYLTIRDLASARPVPFRWNSAQRAYWEARPAKGKILVLKYRQGGFSTLEMADAYDRMKASRGVQQVFLADEGEKAGIVFGIARRFFDSDPSPPALKGEPSRRRMETEGGSWIYVGTAGARTFGRGMTLDKVHGSEVSRWRGGYDVVNDLVAGLTEAAKSGTVVLETTANGTDEWFYRTWMEQPSWAKIFVPWFLDEGCRLPLDREGARSVLAALSDEEKALVATKGLDAGQIAWRRAKKAELDKLFAQEYPEDADTAFLVSGPTLFDTALLAQALRLAPRPIASKRSEVDDGGGSFEFEQFVHAPASGLRYVIGADVAEGVLGGDWSAYSVRDERGTLCKVVRCRDHPDEFAYRLADEGAFWNMAEIVPEKNSIGQSTVDTLENVVCYPNVHDETRWDGARHVPTGGKGWRTTSRSKRELLSGYKEDFERGLWEVPSRMLVSDMRRVTRVGSGTWETSGRDLFMADAIARAVIARGNLRRARSARNPSRRVSMPGG